MGQVRCCTLWRTCFLHNAVCLTGFCFFYRMAYHFLCFQPHINTRMVRKLMVRGCWLMWSVRARSKDGCPGAWVSFFVLYFFILYFIMFFISYCYTGGGLGGTRRGGPDVNIKHSGREDNERERERYRLEREREDRGLDRRPDFRDRGERK